MRLHKYLPMLNKARADFMLSGKYVGTRTLCWRMTELGHNQQLQYYCDCTCGEWIQKREALETVNRSSIMHPLPSILPRYMQIFEVSP